MDPSSALPELLAQSHNISLDDSLRHSSSDFDRTSVRVRIGNEPTENSWPRHYHKVFESHFIK